jgi:uncharacterized protein (UPF0332 family)
VPYIEYITTAEEELDAASLLYEKGFFKESISRSYYSMFHATQALLILKSIYPKSHKGVIQKFGEEFVKPGIIEKKMGEMLAQAETMRLKADYEVGLNINKEECELILENCETFLLKIKEIIKKLKNK